MVLSQKLAQGANMLPRKLTLKRLHNKEAHTSDNETLAHDKRPLQHFQPVWAVLINLPISAPCYCYIT